MKSLVIGASAGLGRSLSLRLAEAGHDLFLVSSDVKDLEPIANDLRIRFNVNIYYLALNLEKINVDELKNEVLGKLGELHNLFYIAGFTTMDEPGRSNDKTVIKLINVNMTAPIRIINTFINYLQNKKNSNIVGIGSTAAARPRKQNSIYGAAKLGIEFYFGTLRHFLAFSPCSVQFYRAGYLNTRMTFGMNLSLPKLNPDKAALKIVGNLNKDLGVVYLPGWWRLIMFIFKMIPKKIYNKLNI